MMAGPPQRARWDFGDQDLEQLLKDARRHKGDSLWSDAWRRLRRDRAAFLCLVFLAGFGLLSFLAPVLPIPSPVAIDLSAGDALPPQWPWASTKLASDWDPELDRDIKPGILPTRTLANYFDDGWRHQALLRFHAPEGADPGRALEEMVRDLSGRRPRREVRPAEGGQDHYLCVPLGPDDAPRVDYESTGEFARLRVAVTELPLPEDAEAGTASEREITYHLDTPRPLGPLKRWSVEQRTRRGQLYLTLESPQPNSTGMQYTFVLDALPKGKVVALVLNGERLDLQGAPAPAAENPPAVQQLETEAREHLGRRHEDLGMRAAAALATSEELQGVELIELSIQDGYWELNALDRWLLSVRTGLFGSWQTGNWMGTDVNGRDILSRIVWGSRTSILVALAAAACSLVIGVVYGAFSGLAGGRIDNLMMRVVDILYSVPFIFVVIFLITVVNEYRTELEDLYGIDRELIFFVVIGAIYWLTMARVVRGQVLSLKNSEFIEAARVLGASTTRILFAHLVPNVLSIVIVYLTLTIPAVMLFEAFLSFLGLGIEPPKVSWGLLAVDGTTAINPLRIYWWLVVFPALAMGLTLLSLNVLGDGLRDALDPKLRGKD